MIVELNSLCSIWNISEMENIMGDCIIKLDTKNKIKKHSKKSAIINLPQNTKEIFTMSKTNFKR